MLQYATNDLCIPQSTAKLSESTKAHKTVNTLHQRINTNNHAHNLLNFLDKYMQIFQIYMHF